MPYYGIALLLIASTSEEDPAAAFHDASNISDVGDTDG